MTGDAETTRESGPTLTAGRLREILQPVCRSHRVDLAGVVGLPRLLPHREAWFAWLAAGRHGDLAYLQREPAERVDPLRRHPWARSVLVFAQRYTNGWPPDDPEAAGGCGEGRPWTAGVSRYARGADYHDVLRRAIRAALAELRRETDRLAGSRGPAGGSALRAEERVDAGPYLEREWAWLAGLGFFGKNTLLIHPRLGSGLFLGVAVTNLAVTALADAPRPLIGPPATRRPEDDGPASLCGRCRRCLDACPTGALVAPYRLDAGRCLSTWSIEWRGGAPAAERPRQGGLLFGCDVCQQVCPWNHKAARLLTEPPPPAYAALPAHRDLELADLLVMDAAAFRERFRRTPLWRCHPEGLRRNALIAAANTGRRDLVSRIREVAAADPDPGVRETARWALATLGCDVPAGDGDDDRAENAIPRGR